MDYAIWFTELWRWWSILLQTVVRNTMMYFIVVIAEAERLRIWTSCLNLVWAEQPFTERRRQRSGTWDITSLRLWCHSQRTNGISLHFLWKRNSRECLQRMNDSIILRVEWQRPLQKRYRSEYTCMLIIERMSLGVICSEMVAKLTTIWMKIRLRTNCKTNNAF